MDISYIQNVEVYNIWGTIVYIVTTIDNTIWFVPNDPDNRDWPAVQEWLALNGGGE